MGRESVNRRARRAALLRRTAPVLALAACLSLAQAAPASAHEKGTSRTDPTGSADLTDGTSPTDLTDPTDLTAPTDASRDADAPGVPPFYDPPAELPAGNGELVRTEPLPLGLSLPGVPGLTEPLPGTATRLMYTSTDAHGEPVAVTGAYVEPSAEWKGDGPRPLVAVAPGTMGQGDQCAASLALEHPISINGRSVSVGYEDIGVYRLLARGIGVVVTDYAGLGSPDRTHTYVNRAEEGHAVLDAVRAARKVEGASVTDASPVGLYGYSQGGGAVAAAAELQRSYAPDVTLSGTYAGAPPADLRKVVDGIDGSALAGALGWSVNGFLESDPEVRDIFEKEVDSEGKKALSELSQMCTGDAVLGYGFSDSARWTTSGKGLGAIVDAEPRLRELLRDQRLGLRKPAGPVRVATGTEDDIVPHAQARQLAVDWCGKGGDVTYEGVKLPNLGDRLLTNHLAPLLADQGAALSWLTDRLSGKPAAAGDGAGAGDGSDCGALGD